MLDDGHTQADGAAQTKIVREIEEAPEADPIAIVTLCE